MSVVTDSNYTQPSAATYHNLDSDQYSRALSYTNTLIDLLAHDHRTTHGLAAGRLTTNAIAATANTGECQVVAGGLKVTDGTSVNNLTDVAANGATVFKCLGITGATAASRYVGATAAGAPTSGTFAKGDFIVDQGGLFWICTAAGSPGTWARAGSPPTGVITPFSNATLPSNALWCDGAPVSRTNYASLFALVSTTYGVGDGGTTFNVPDFRSRVPMGGDNFGQGAASRTTNALGTASGEDSHTLTASESAVLAYSSAVTDPNHSHPALGRLSTGGASDFVTGSTGTQNNVTIGAAATGITVATTANAGGTAHNTRQLSLGTYYVIWT